MFKGDGTQASEAFTPTWTTSGTAPTFGSSFLVGTFTRRGNSRWIDVYFRLLAGTGVNFGTGTLRFATPPEFPPLDEYVTYLCPVGRGFAFDGTNRPTFDVIISNTAYVDLRSTAGTAVSGTVPNTLGVGDSVGGQYSYEANI